MQSKAATPKEYIASLPAERKETISALRALINKNLPTGFDEVMGHGMICWVVPHSIYPAGYHVNPKLPLMMVSLGSQKNYISLHHMGLYKGPLLDWFTKEWKHSTTEKLDVGKCCVRFKKPLDIPMDLIAILVSKLTPQQWAAQYENARAAISARPSPKKKK